MGGEPRIAEAKETTPRAGAKGSKDVVWSKESDYN